MATTTNYGWTTPDDTALVKDGASAIRTLGTSVDTTTKNLNPSTTLGDIEYRSSTSNTNTRLGIGSTGQVLTVSGGVPAWSTVSSGGYTQLATGSLSGTTTTISSISGSYRNLQLVIQNAIPASQAGMGIRFNTDSGTNYLATVSIITNTAFNQSYINVATDQHTSGSNLIVVDIYDYANSSTRKVIRASSITQNNGTPNFNLYPYSGAWSSTAAITDISMGFGAFTVSTSSGTYYLYGVK
jgi:hypothetical protein